MDGKVPKPEAGGKSELQKEDRTQHFAPGVVAVEPRVKEIPPTLGPKKDFRAPGNTAGELPRRAGKGPPGGATKPSRRTRCLEAPSGEEKCDAVVTQSGLQESSIVTRYSG